MEWRISIMEIPVIRKFRTNLVLNNHLEKLKIFVHLEKLKIFHLEQPFSVERDHFIIS